MAGSSWQPRGAAQRAFRPPPGERRAPGLRGRSAAPRRAACASLAGADPEGVRRHDLPRLREPVGRCPRRPRRVSALLGSAWTRLRSPSAPTTGSCGVGAALAGRRPVSARPCPRSAAPPAAGGVPAGGAGQPDHVQRRVRADRGGAPPSSSRTPTTTITAACPWRRSGCCSRTTGSRPTSSSPATGPPGRWSCRGTTCPSASRRPGRRSRPRCRTRARRGPARAGRSLSP